MPRADTHLWRSPPLCFCVAFFAPTQTCARGALPCLGFLSAKKLWQDEDSGWTRGKDGKRAREDAGSSVLCCWKRPATFCAFLELSSPGSGMEDQFSS